MVKWIGDRISHEDKDGITTIVIRPIKNGWKEWLLTFWVFSFTFVGLVMIYLLFTDFEALNQGNNPDDETLQNQTIYAVVFIAFWAYFEYKTVKSLLWYKYGKELLMIDDEALSIKKSILSYGKAQRYFFENIKEFHQRKPEPTNFNNFFENAYWAIGTDALAFEYFGKQKSMGRRLTDQHGRLLLRLIDDRVRKKLKQKRKKEST